LKKKNLSKEKAFLPLFTKEPSPFQGNLYIYMNRESRKFSPNHDLYAERLNGKCSDELKSQMMKPHKKGRNEKSLKEKKEDFLRDYIKSESESKRYRKK
jgi:hypothetical protein